MQLFDEFRDTITNRLKGTFGGTFVLVWIILNWEILYTLFNFDSDCNLQDKLLILDRYSSNNYPHNLIIYPILLTLVSVISYNALNYITYAITSFFLLRVKPFIINKVDSNHIVEKTRFDNLQNEYFKLDDKHKSDQANFIGNVSENESLKKENNQLKIRVSEKEKDLDAFKLNSISQEQAIRKMYDDKIDDMKSQLKNKDLDLSSLRDNSILKENNNDADMFFEGTWIKIFTPPNGVKGQEKFKVSDNKYMIGQKPIFEFQSISTFDQNNFIEIRKIRPETGEVLVDKLVKITPQHYTGSENTNIEIVYKRLS